MVAIKIPSYLNQKAKKRGSTGRVISFLLGCFATCITMLTALNIFSLLPGAPPRTPTYDMEDDDRPHYLETLMYKYGSDKSHDDHGYTDLYQMLFDPIRLSVKNITEVGISAGQSIQAWYHYFPNADIHAYDIETTESTAKITKHMSDRVHYTEIDLLSKNLTDMGLHNNTMDLIIDDATHMPWQQQAFLPKLFGLLKPGGYYVIEDIALNHEPSKKFHQFPEQLNPEVQHIMQSHDTIFVDTASGHRAWKLQSRDTITASGHRAWKLWLERTVASGVAKDHVIHNSYLLVIRKRHTPLPPVKMNLREFAMIPGKVVLDTD